MSTKRLFDHDPVLGSTEIFHCDESTGDFAIETIADVEPVLEHNKGLFNSGHDGYNAARDMQKVASIPLIVADIWLAKYGVNLFDKHHMPAVKRLLNSSEWAYLRTAPGTL